MSRQPLDPDVAEQQVSIKTQHFTAGLFPVDGCAAASVCKCLCLRRVKEGQHGKTDACL